MAQLVFLEKNHSKWRALNKYRYQGPILSFNDLESPVLAQEPGLVTR